MSDDEWCRQKLNSLQIKEGREETLSEIRNRLNQPADEQRLASNLLTSSEIFECLDESAADSSQKALVVDILSICMSNLNIDQVDIPKILEKSLTNSNPRVRAIALNEIERVLDRNPDRVTIDSDVVMSVIACLESTDVADAGVAIKILSRVLVHEFDNHTIRSEFVQRLEAGDITRCRVYEVAINLARSSSLMLDKVHNIIDRAIAELDSGDVLLQLNILELLVSLAEQNHGFSYLENKKVLHKISKRVELIDNNPLDQFLIPGIMKFFGKIAFAQPEKIILGYPLMVQCLFDCLSSSSDVSILPTAFDTLANLVSTPQGKIILETNYSESLQQAFGELGSYLRNLPTDLKNRLFNTLELIFRVEGQVNNQVSSITEKWCTHLSGCTDIQFLLDFCKNPFPDIKVACLSFVKALCSYQWGMVALRETAGFIEYILDRRVEFDKDAKMVKYEIITILSRSCVFNAQTILQLKKYVEEGPHYVEGIVEVAVDGC